MKNLVKYADDWGCKPKLSNTPRKNRRKSGNTVYQDSQKKSQMVKAKQTRKLQSDITEKDTIPTFKRHFRKYSKESNQHNTENVIPLELKPQKMNFSSQLQNGNKMSSFTSDPIFHNQTAGRGSFLKTSLIDMRFNKGSSFDIKRYRSRHSMIVQPKKLQGEHWSPSVIKIKSKKTKFKGDSSKRNPGTPWNKENGKERRKIMFGIQTSCKFWCVLIYLTINLSFKAFLWCYANNPDNMDYTCPLVSSSTTFESHSFTWVLGSAVTRILGLQIFGYQLDRLGWVNTVKIDGVAFGIICLLNLTTSKENFDFFQLLLMGSYYGSQILALSCGFFMWSHQLGLSLFPYIEMCQPQSWVFCLGLNKMVQYLGITVTTCGAFLLLGALWGFLVTMVNNYRDKSRMNQNFSSNSV